MAAAALPAGWDWIDDDIARLKAPNAGIQQHGSQRHGFIDENGTIVALHDSANGTYTSGIGYSYSTDGGTNWTEPGGSPFDFNSIEGGRMTMWWDVDNNLLIVGASGASTYPYLSALTWDPSGKTFTHDASSAALESSSLIVVGSIFAGYSGTDLYVGMIAEDGASDDLWVGTAIYDTATPGWSGEGSDTIAATVTFSAIVVETKGPKSGPPRSLTTPTTDSFYAMFDDATGSNPQMGTGSWNGANSKFEWDSTTNNPTSGGLAGLAFNYNEDQDRFYYVSAYVSTWDIGIWKSDTNDPEGAWTKVWQKSVDEGSPPTSQSGTRYIAADYNRQSELIWVAMADTSDDWYVYDYDTNADTHNETYYNFPADSLNQFYPGFLNSWDGTNEITALTVDLWSSAEGDFRLAFHQMETTAAPVVASVSWAGWGFIPI